ncbi:MAG: peroxide stress protein YaaA [Candidatus Hodarchaeales archaeon]|jgi:cytoplasmic iron level regulating protein YaaA (DUF328/UPF0246 family)
MFTFKQPKVLIIVSCSKKKAQELLNQELQAVRAYTGPMFQVIHKAQREGNWNSNLHLGVISAKYGFLRSDDLISFYELKMTEKLAEKLRVNVIQAILNWHNRENFDLIYVLMGKIYLKAVEGLKSHLRTDVVIENMGGLGLGQQKLVKFITNYSGKPKNILDYLK